MENALFTPALVEVALVTIRGIFGKASKATPIPHLPLPSEYLDILIVFGGLSLLPGQANRVGGYIGWGLVIATALNMSGAFAKLNTGVGVAETPSGASS